VEELSRAEADQSGARWQGLLFLVVYFCLCSQK
jgi:hypothetical protein